MEHVIDAQGKKIGRIATEAAMHLMGKAYPDYVANKVKKVTVKIINAGQADISEKKMLEKEYIHHSGYRGGLKRIPMHRLIEKKGVGEVFREAVYGMLPKNKLRTERIKQLIVKE